MKQGSDAQNTVAPGSGHYSNNSKGFILRYIVVFLPVLFLLFITGYKKNEPQHSSPHSNIAGSAAGPGSKIRWVAFKGSFKAIDEMTQAGTNADPRQTDPLAGRVIFRASIEIYTGGDIYLHIPANLTSAATFTTASGDKIVGTGFGYVQVKKFTKVFIYLL